MEVIKAGKAKPVPRGRSVARKAEVSDDEVPSKIEVLNTHVLSQVVPSHVWRCKPFKWDPQAFATESEELNQKFIEASVQDRSLVKFLADPYSPMIYGVAGNPDDVMAKYLAAYLVAAHVKRAQSAANVWWIPLYGNYQNPWLDETKRRPSMIVITNLTPRSTDVKLEKARDILEAHPDVPRIVVSVGMDPLSFLTTKLNVPVNGIAYLASSLIKQKVAVI